MVETLLLARGVMFLAGMTMLGVALWIRLRRDSPALWPFVVLVAAVGTLGALDGLAAGDLTSLSLVWETALIGIPCAFTWFVVEYYGLPHLASLPRKVAFIAPAAVGVAGGGVLVLSPTASGSMAGGPSGPAMPALTGFAVIAEQVGIYYAGGVMLAGVGLLARTVATYDHLDGRLGVVLSFIPVWPWLAYFLTPGIAGRVPLDVIIGLTASGYVLSLAAVVFAVTRGGLFEAAPAAGTLGPETVISDLDDAVIVVDRDHRVVWTNESARRTFGLEAATGEPFAECVGVEVDSLRDSESVELTVPDGTRHFEATISPVRDRFDRQPGYAVVITDVTQERVRSQRLTVLNRVLRHNLRNQMTHIRGRAEIIASSDSDHRDTAENIVSSADELVSLSERAREVEDVLSQTADPTTEVALADLAEAVIEPYREEFPDATLSVDIEDSLRLTVDRLVLSSVLDNLVENALVHNDAPTPVVTVSARETGDGSVRLSVSDNGPGIPESERAVIESGTESALDHGSGLGLWAVKWGVIRLGGELSLRDGTPEGAVVSVILPNVTRRETAAPPQAEAD